MALASVAQDGDGFALEGCRVGIMLIENGGHGAFSLWNIGLSPMFTVSYLTQSAMIGRAIEAL